jgi:hypothetical protein
VPSSSLVRCAVAASEHPLPAESTGEVAGHLLDAGLRGADMLVVAVAAGLSGALEDVATTLASLVDARHCLGVCSSDLVGGGRCLGPGGLVALAVAGAPWQATRLSADARLPPAVAAGAVPALVVAPPGTPPPSAPAALGGCAPALPVSVHLDGRDAPDGAVAWCEADDGARVARLGGWRPIGPPWRADGTDAGVATLDGLPAAEVVLGELAALAEPIRDQLIDVALRVRRGEAGQELVSLGVGESRDVLRTSVPVRPGDAVELVVRDARALTLELERRFEAPRPPAALVCSPLLGTGSVLVDPRRAATRLARTVASSSREHPVIGLALDVGDRPAPVSILLCGA